MTTYAWYVGPASVRTIKAADWTGQAIANTGDTVWNAANTFSLDQATLSAGQIAFLAAQSEFLTGQVSVRPSGAAVSNPDGPVTQSQFKALMAAAFASDGGSVTQWLANTFAAQGTMWAYQGIMYLRKIDGTDTVFTRSNWTALGTDPTVAGGGELFSVELAASQSIAATAAFADMPGMVVSPVVPSGGRPIYIDLDASVATNTAAITASFQLYDVTAGAAIPGQLLYYLATANKFLPIFRRWRITPPASGARVYKLQVASTPNATVGNYGPDLLTKSGMYVTTR